MHLKRIELLGFKSFASKTVLELDRGMTAVVGPNGSGKSNLVDAIRWALGEQSPRAIRSRKSEDVIFAGSTRRSPVGMAEVTLVFDNSDGELPLSFVELSITRRQYRSGEGEYLINRSRARLKDVVELLSHASLGPDGYSVVSQGAVDEVLLQRPEERRAMLETAADISRHQVKLKESLDRLSETEANIRRVEDIREEIAPRLNRLRTQANRARRYEDLLARLKTVQRCQYLLQLREAREMATAHQEMVRQRERIVADAVMAHASAQQQLLSLRERLREEESGLDMARERQASLRLARAQAERELALARERETALRHQLKESEDDLTRARGELRELQEEMESLSAARAGLSEQETNARSKVAPVEAEWRQASSEQRLLQAQLERLLGEQQAAARRRSELNERRASLVREARRAEEAGAEGTRAADEAASRLAELERQLSASQGEIERLRSRVAELEAAHRESQKRLRELEQETEAARRKEREAWEQDHDLRNRLSLLRSLKEEHRGVPPGARAILDAKLPGIRGPLASMIQVPGPYVAAVAAALGGAQGYVVSDGFHDGLEALRFLAKRPGRVTIAPLRLEKKEPPRVLVEEFRSRLEGLLEGIGFRGLAADLVSCPAEARDLCDRYLGLSLVVDSMADAVELYHRLSNLMDGRLPFQIVTLDGRLVRARGDLASTQSGEKDGGLLAREAELLSLDEAARRAEARLKEVRAGVASLEASMADLSRQAAATSAEASRIQQEIGKRGAAHAELASRVAKLEAAIEWHRSRAATAVREGAQARAALATVDRELASASAREMAARDRVAQLRDDLAAQQSVLAEVASVRSRLQLDLSRVQSRLREEDARIATLSEAIQRTVARVRRQEERVSQLSGQLTELCQNSRAALPGALEQELDDVEKLISEASPRVAELRERVAAEEARVASLSGALESAREELAEARGRSQRSAVELEALLREVVRELDLEDGTDLAPHSPSLMRKGETFSPLPKGEGQGEGWSGEPHETSVSDARIEGSNRLSAPSATEALTSLERAAQVVVALESCLEEIPAKDLPATAMGASERVRALQRELHALGTVNAEAPEEYRLTSERYAFLTEQLDDLRNAERTLRKAIDDLREVMEARFQETFERVNAEFVRCFSILFGGGSARLALTKPEEPLDGGVEVLAAPPGRRGGALLSLSGGERALTAVALLFALMRVSPSPFCVLDEVDAALDESNVQRFCQMVLDLTDKTQFLLITHNRTSMEMAGALYGVSMSPDLTSRVVSLKLG